MTKKKAIIFNCHYNGLAIIQALGKEGIECIAMDSDRSIGTYSKYAKYIKCPDPTNNEKEFVEFLYSFCANEKEKPILFPTNDHWAAAISKNKNKLFEVSIPCVAEWDTVKILLEKEKFYELGEWKGYLTPKTWTIRSIDTIETHSFPIVAKPEFRRMSSDNDQTELLSNMDRLRLVKLADKRELEEFIKREDKYVDFLLFQEYISGLSDQMYTVGVYANEESDVLGLFSGKKVRGYPADIGDCIIGESIIIPKEIEELTRKITKEINYKGIAEFEFKLDVDTNKFRLIEINPRSWSWIGITSSVNINLALIAYNDLSGKRISREISKQRNNVAYVKILEDLPNVLFRYKKTHPDWSMSYRDWRKSLKKYDKLVIAEFNKKDPMVSIISILTFARNVVNKFI